jgi:hypothetical protein
MSARRFIKCVFGLLSFVIGIAILTWCAYSFFVPNQHFHMRITDLPRLLLPFVFIWLGWSWMRGEPSQAAQYATELVVTLKLFGTHYGAEPERQRIFELKHRLERKLAQDDLASIDGEEFGDGECNLFVQTDDPAKAANAIRQFLASENSVSYTLTMRESAVSS